MPHLSTTAVCLTTKLFDPCPACFCSCTCAASGHQYITRGPTEHRSSLSGYRITKTAVELLVALLTDTTTVCVHQGSLKMCCAMLESTASPLSLSLLRGPF